MRLGRSAMILVALIARVAVAQPARRPPARLIDLHLQVWDSLPAGRQFRDSLLAAFEHYHLERAVVSGAIAPVRGLAALAPDRVLAGVSYGPGLELPTPEGLRGDFRGDGSPCSARSTPRGSASPSAGHTSRRTGAERGGAGAGRRVHGRRAAGTPLRACCTGYRATAARLQDVEEVLVRHPTLRVDLMQAGWPYREPTVALMHSYPELYADLGNLAGNPSIPGEEFFD
jgi:hypothetical protein